MDLPSAEENPPPIKIQVQVEDKRYNINGNVTVVVLANGDNVYEMKKEIGSGVENQKEKGMESKNGLRQRAVVEKKSTSNGKSIESAQEDSKSHFPTLDDAKNTAQNIAQKVLDSWQWVHFVHLPEWLKDNEYLQFGYRPPIPSFAECFKSIFRIHTETGNIWSHLLGCILFSGFAFYFLTRPHTEVHWKEKLVLTPFFVGAIACLALSFTFHTVGCHSERVGKFFNKLDYVGILLLIIGSFVPWLYYGFYCRPEPKIIYMITIIVLGSVGLVMALWDKFATPNYRTLRAGVFTALGMFGVVPFIHFVAVYGYHRAAQWLVVMGALYLTGAVLYASRIPERFFPGKCDIWMQSHQIFHLFVVAAVMAHYRGITEMRLVRLSGECPCY